MCKTNFAKRGKTCFVCLLLSMPPLLSWHLSTKLLLEKWVQECTHQIRTNKVLVPPVALASRSGSNTPILRVNGQIITNIKKSIWFTNNAVSHLTAKLMPLVKVSESSLWTEHANSNYSFLPPTQNVMAHSSFSIKTWPWISLCEEAWWGLFISARR